LSGDAESMNHFLRKRLSVLSKHAEIFLFHFKPVLNSQFLNSFFISLIDPLRANSILVPFSKILIKLQTRISREPSWTFMVGLLSRKICFLPSGPPVQTPDVHLHNCTMAFKGLNDEK